MDKRIPILIFVFVLAVYLLTLSPTINSFDSAEFVTGAYTLGIVHAPGYPLYLLLGHLFISMLNISAPVAVNFMSAFFAAVCVSVVFLINFHLSKSNLWSLVSALMLAFSSLFWSKAVIAEVYSLNGLFVALLFLTFLYLKDSYSLKYQLAFFLVAGTGLTHHTSVVLILPWFFAAFVISSIRRISVSGLVFSLLSFLAPLSLYCYFPIRSRANPLLDYIRTYFDFVDLTTLQGVYWMVSGKMFQQEMWGRTFGEFYFQLLKLLADLWLNFFGVGIILAVIALLWYVRNKKLIGFVVLASVLSVLVFFSAYNVVDSREMTIPALILLAPFISVGGVLLEKNVTLPHHALINSKLLILVFLIVVTMVIVNWGAIDRSNDRLAYQYAEAILETVEPNSLILTQWTAATPLEYMILVEGRRYDVEIFDRGLYSLGVRAKLLECTKNSNMLQGCAELKDNSLQIYINSQLPVRPVYITEYDPALRRDFCLVDSEYLYRVLPLYACN
jgi:hypothetical protein